MSSASNNIQVNPILMHSYQVQADHIIDNAIRGNANAATNEYNTLIQDINWCRHSTVGAMPNLAAKVSRLDKLFAQPLTTTNLDAIAKHKWKLIGGLGLVASCFSPLSLIGSSLAGLAVGGIADYLDNDHSLLHQLNHWVQSAPTDKQAAHREAYTQIIKLIMDTNHNTVNLIHLNLECDPGISNHPSLVGKTITLPVGIPPPTSFIDGVSNKAYNIGVFLKNGSYALAGKSYQTAAYLGAPIRDTGYAVVNGLYQVGTSLGNNIGVFLKNGSYALAGKSYQTAAYLGAPIRDTGYAVVNGLYQVGTSLGNMLSYPNNNIEVDNSEYSVEQLNNQITQLDALFVTQKNELDTFLPCNVSAQLSTWVGKLNSDNYKHNVWKAFYNPEKDYDQIDDKREAMKSRIDITKKLIYIFDAARTNELARNDFIAALDDASTSCGDKIILSMIQMYASHHLATTNFTNLQERVDYLKKGVLALSLIEEMTRNQIQIYRQHNQHMRMDEVEVYLNTLINVAHDCDLPILTQVHKYCEIQITIYNDIVKNVHQLLSTKQKWLQKLIELPNWIAHLESIMPIKIQALKDRRTKDSGSFNNQNTVNQADSKYKQDLINHSDQLITQSEEWNNCFYNEFPDIEPKALIQDTINNKRFNPLIQTMIDHDNLPHLIHASIEQGHFEQLVQTMIKNNTFDKLIQPMIDDGTCHRLVHAVIKQGKFQQLRTIYLILFTTNLC